MESGPCAPVANFAPLRGHTFGPTGTRARPNLTRERGGTHSIQEKSRVRVQLKKENLEASILYPPPNAGQFATGLASGRALAANYNWQ